MPAKVFLRLIGLETRGWEKSDERQELLMRWMLEHWIYLYRRLSVTGYPSVMDDHNLLITILTNTPDTLRSWSLLSEPEQHCWPEPSLRLRVKIFSPLHNSSLSTSIITDSPVSSILIIKWIAKKELRQSSNIQSLLQFHIQDEKE